jgi:hypothetical protein
MAIIVSYLSILQLDFKCFSKWQIYQPCCMLDAFDKLNIDFKLLLKKIPLLHLKQIHLMIFLEMT